MGCSQILLNSNPFYCENIQLAETQLLILDIIRKLWKNGWKCGGKIQISQSIEDKVVLIIFLVTIFCPQCDLIFQH